MEFLAPSSRVPSGTGAAGEAHAAVTFSPRLDMLPEEQRTLCPELARVPKSPVLYGGTAVAVSMRFGSMAFPFVPCSPRAARPASRVPRVHGNDGT